MPYDPSKLLELAARCEAATEPDRELDFSICRIALNRYVGVAKFTSSLDAAQTLLPEEWTSWGVWSKQRKTRFYAVLSRLRDDFSDDEMADEEDVQSRRCSSPALALCAAALRARAAGEVSRG